MKQGGGAWVEERICWLDAEERICYKQGTAHTRSPRLPTLILSLVLSLSQASVLSLALTLGLVLPLGPSVARVLALMLVLVQVIELNAPIGRQMRGRNL